MKHFKKPQTQSNWKYFRILNL